MIRELNVREITETVATLCISANRELSPDIEKALDHAIVSEPHAPAKELLQILKQNALIARRDQMPICQDTGMAIVFIDIGQDVHLIGDALEAAVNAGVQKGYTEGFLRSSVVTDPLFKRLNTGDNTPAVLHTRIVPGDQVKITVAPKGFGSENMSRVKMLSPSDGVAAVKDFVVETVKRAGPNPCPPMVIGVGIGGSFEKAALLAKQALALPLDAPNPDSEYAVLEEELLALVNETGIGAQGFGGKTTALGLKVLWYPTHIAGLPVAVNIGCHVTRHQTRII